MAERRSTPGPDTPADASAADTRPGRESHGSAETAGGPEGEARYGAPGPAASSEYHKPLWLEDPAPRRRMADPVRTAAVRAVLIVSVTLVQAMVAFLCTLTGSWLAFPMVLSSVVSTVAATWGVLDVWITRQVWNQRHGVVSTPSSSARRLRRDRRRARREARAAERALGRIRGPRRGGPRRLSHP